VCVTTTTGSAMSNSNGLQSQTLCHYLDQGAQ